MNCSLDVSDGPTAYSVRAVLELCGITYCDADGDIGADAILITDSPDADVSSCMGCVMLTRSAAAVPESASVKALNVPFSYAEFIEVLKALDTGSAAMPSAPQKREETSAEILIHDGCVSGAKGNVQLTEREAALFEYMLSRRGEIVTREEIMHCVWSENSGGTNVADVYISYLRKKLEPFFGRGAIITVRGRGYMLDLPAHG